MTVRIIEGDCRAVLKTLPDKSVHMAVTSPPYLGKRDYDVAGQIGLEATPAEFVAEMVMVFREVRRVLRDDGTCWLNIGDSYAGSWGAEGRRGLEAKNAYNASVMSRNQITNHPKTARSRMSIRAAGIKPKDLMGIPWRVAFALQDDGWYLRQDIIWHKPNPMPESVNDRCTTAHEYFFLFSKSRRYFYDAEAVAEPVSPNTNARLSQDLTAQIGSLRANGGTRPDRPMKAMGRKTGAREDGIKNNESFTEATCLPVNGRNKRSVWTVPTEGFAGAHFATFPPALILPAILAGTSARGCCVKCSAPWQRIIAPSARYAEFLGRGFTDHTDDDGMGMMQNRGINRQNAARDEGGVTSKEVETIGWYPTCQCDRLPPLPSYPPSPRRTSHESVYEAALAAWRVACRDVDAARKILCDPAAAIASSPAVVLDPFGGAATTALVADRNGRDALLIEINPAYAEMGRQRVRGDSPLFSEVR